MADILKQRDRKVPPDYSNSFDVSARSRGQEGPARQSRVKPSSSNAENGYDFNGLFSAGENGRQDIPYASGIPEDREFTRFQDRLRRGKVKLCASCGGVMTKSSRMILSSLAGVLLTVLGIALMVGYGLATIFFETPWYIRYALPACYYIGSIFVGVGILFFFIREKVWYCPKCKGIDKR